MEPSGDSWTRFIDWLATFGSGPTGLVALAMVLLAFVIWRCLPTMWKDWLDHKTTDKELELERTRIELEIANRIEKLGEEGGES
jgi:hypothetical protein